MLARISRASPGPHDLSKAPAYWLLAGGSLAVYVVLAVTAPLPPNAGRLVDISTFAPWPQGALAYALLLTAAFGLYWLAFRLVAQWRGPLPLRAVLLPSLAFCLPLLLTYPFNATDIYYYLLWGREIVFERLNPYLVPLSALDGDVYVRFAREWGKGASPYGPAWQLVGAAVAWLGGAGPDLMGSLVLFKLLATAAFVGTTVCIWLLLGRAAPGQRAGRTLLWAWNPALLLSFAGNGHNDSLMLLWLVLGLWIWRRGKPAAGLLVMVLAAWVKITGLLPIPFFFLEALREQEDSRQRLRLAGLVAAGSLAITALLFLPFGSPLKFGGLMLKEADTGGGFTPLAMLLLNSRKLGIVLPVRPLVWMGIVVLALTAAGLAWRTWRGRSSLWAATDIFATYLLVALRFRLWYASWPFPWALLYPSAEPASLADAGFLHYRLRASLWFLATTQYSVLLYGQVWAALMQRNTALSHLIGVPFTFGLPLLLAALIRPRPTPAVSRSGAPAERPPSSPAGSSP